LPEISERSLDKNYVLESLQAIGYDELGVRNALDTLLREALLESVEGVREQEVEQISISAKGLTYRTKLIYEYSYLVMICDDVPMLKKYQVDIVSKFGTEKIPLERGDLSLKHESVRLFLRFLEEEEKEEFDSCPPLKRALIGQIVGPKRTAATVRPRIEDTIKRMTKTWGMRRTKRIYSIIYPEDTD